MIKKLFKHKFELILVAIILLAAVLRFANYNNRWGLAYDQARDVTVATYALTTNQFPLTGPFSSAGQFVYGPQWFLILMGMIEAFPFSVMGPWILQTLLYVFLVYLVYLIGKEISDKRLGLIAAFLTAISTAQIGQSTNLISPSMAGIFSVISVYFFIRYIKYSKNLDGFLLSFFVANTINIHFQAIGLLALLPISFLFSKNKSIKQFFLLGVGFFIPFIPLIIFDLKTNFFESRNFLDYYLYGQYRIYVPNRWLTYVGVFWPKTWAEVIGGQQVMGYILIALLSIVSLYKVLTRKITREVLALILAFLVMFTMLRYYRGVLFGGYIVFLQSFILILTSWSIYEVFKKQKILFFILILLISIFTLSLDYKENTIATNNTAKEAISLKNQLIQRFPDEKFSVYDYKFSQATRSYALIMYLNKENKLDDKGKKIGLANFDADFKMRKDLPTILQTKDKFEIYDLSSSSSATLIKDKWVFVNPSEVYKTTINWYWNK